MEVSKKQKELLELINDPTLNELLLGGSAGGSTVFGHPVKTPTGEKLIEDIEIGDIICNSDGGSSRVINIPWEGEMESYKLTFVDGSSTEVSKKHLWKYRRAGFSSSSSQGFRIGTTEQLVEEIQKYNLLVPLTKPVVFNREFTNKHYISPYLLGVLLGDGSFCVRGENGIRLRICCPDEFIIERCRKCFNGNISGPGKRGRDWTLFYCNEEREAIREFGLLNKKSQEKFIPERFKYGSIEERKEILQGLMDTDGWTDRRGHLQFSTTSIQMAEDVQFIVRSLGGNATITSENQVGKELNFDGHIAHRNFINYKVYIQHEHKEWFVSLPRKLERVKPYNGGRGHLYKRILKIEPVGIKKSRCITTSAEDGLYLTDDFIVTHNSKTFCVCLALVLLSKQYPGSRFFVGRKTLKSLKQSTINTLLTKVHPMMGIKDDDFAMHWQDMVLDYVNGSKIIFGELEKTPSDQDFARLGSLEIDIAFIEEAGEVSLEAKNAIKSRVGRGVMSSKYGIPGKCILSCNPAGNFLKEEYYEPYKRLGGGAFQKWQIGTVEVNGKKLPSYRGFFRMGVYDNPFMPQSYIDNLKTLPEKQRKRLLDGDWEYADDEDSLFKAGLLDKAITFNLPEDTSLANAWIGVDVSDIGKDRSVFTLMKGGVVISQKVSSVQMNWDKESKQPISRLLADELISFAMTNGFTQKFANHITVECNGVGAALRDALKERGWYLTEYTATHKSRSQGYYDLMMAIDSGELKIYNEIMGLTELRQELGAHTYKMSNQEPDVIKKDKIKLVIGRSPDLADSLMICNWGREFSTTKDPRRNSARIAW